MTSPATNRSLSKHQRGHLSRELITEAGLRVAHQNGIGNLTMKRLAAELSVTPMAIYRHFEDKSDLIDAVLDQYVQEQDICNHSIAESDWSNWLFKTYTNMYQGLQSMPSVYPYLSTASRFGPGASAMVEHTLKVMQDAGFSFQSATRAANALNGFVIGCAIMDNAFYQNLVRTEHEQTRTALENDAVSGLDNGLGLIISALKHEHKDNHNQE